MTLSRYRARGFTLIEALVALVVLSIGLLGIASLQLTSLRYNQNASLRSQATLLAYDIIDRMRANSQAAANGNYNVDFMKTPTGTSLAAQDVKSWKALIKDTFPKGDAQITSSGAGSSTTYTVTISWDDTRGDADAELTSLVMSTQL